ncbi:phosphate-starvation-inducible protein PsiE [Psychrobacter sp. DAB_AL32B]|uniref:phosphate-starvation-inducible protein PsiE n=1 Tax=Psychrobacter sp. DAB_AL32B TaxID=1028414 RepID=UPI0020C26DA4|nr:phosphate-starvation-inducible PsiE family protein [Psychrobacter sp. DAB_AL32B]
MKPLSEQRSEQEISREKDANILKPNMGMHERLQYIGREFVDICHYIILFLISVVVVWTAGKEFFIIFQKGSADLKDILLLFIYLELLAMIGIYFKTHRLPVQFLIFIAITALSRHLVVDVQAVSDNFHLWLLATISFAIMVLSASIVILTWTAKMFGRPEDYLDDHQVPSTEHHLPSVDSK